MFYGYFPPKNGSKCDSKKNAAIKLVESYCVRPWKTKTNYNKETEHDLQKVTRILTLFYNPFLSSPKYVVFLEILLCTRTAHQ